MSVDQTAIEPDCNLFLLLSQPECSFCLKQKQTDKEKRKNYRKKKNEIKEKKGKKSKKLLKNH